MNILGLTTEGDSGATLVTDGKIVASINEERICRMKLVIGFPRGAIDETLRLADIGKDDVDAIFIASTKDLLADELEPFNGWFQHKSVGIGGILKTYGVSAFCRLGRNLPFIETAYYAMLKPSFEHRKKAIRRILREEFGFKCPIEFVDHHFCHIASAYYTSGFQNSLGVSIDGGGDALSALVYSIDDGKFEELHRVSAYNSLGNYYAYVTHLCGFKAMKHEGKITGLSAHGEPKYVDLLDGFITEKNGTFINKGGVASRAAIAKLQKSLPQGWKREDLAASIQRHTEDLTVRFVQHWLKASGQTKVAAAGGVFANVRINQDVLEIPECSNFFVHPHMGDGGLATGAALAACNEMILDPPMARCHDSISDVYLGGDLLDHEIDIILDKHGIEAEEIDGDLADYVAGLLAEGYVVARASGRMEYGPRALGNRTIMYHPTDPSVNTWLNERLNRTEFMPFAPATLFEEAHRCFTQLDGAEHASEFMTITSPCTDYAKEHMPGVVHIDGTARPQLVKKEINPGFHAIIKAFFEKTGLPAVINTSFNMHEEPIVSNANDCVRAFLDGKIDYLILGDRLIRHPNPVEHQLTPVATLDRIR